MRSGLRTSQVDEVSCLQSLDSLNRTELIFLFALRETSGCFVATLGEAIGELRPYLQPSWQHNSNALRGRDRYLMCDEMKPFLGADENR
jgi:hypothetical protein